MYWAGPSRVVYAATRFVAAQAGFDDAFIYEEINLTGTERRIPFEFRQINESQAPFLSWEQKETKDLY
jgi:hypothetical protein